MSKITNPINISGKKLEKAVEEFFILKDYNFDRPKGKGVKIDFILETTEGRKYNECKNQNTDGSVDEKIPFTVWKYRKKYKINHIIIVHGEKYIKKSVKDCINKLMPDMKVEYYNFYSFCRVMQGKKVMGDLELCMN